MYDVFFWIDEVSKFRCISALAPELIFTCGYPCLSFYCVARCVEKDGVFMALMAILQC